MKGGADLEIASDHREYVINTLYTMRKINLFESVFPEPGYMLHMPGRPETTYEKEFRAEGRKIHYMRFKNMK
jgi:tRNA G46 methylase TrmB